MWSYREPETTMYLPKFSPEFCEMIERMDSGDPPETPSQGIAPERLAPTAGSPWSDAPETLTEWRKSETMRPDPRAKRMANHAVKMERQRNAALDALNKIESLYVDGDDTYEAWKAMGEIAATFLKENEKSPDAGATEMKP